MIPEPAPGGIAVVLPPSEHFSPVNAGAISLCVRDFAVYSRDRDRIAVYGVEVEQPFDDVAFVPVRPRGLIGSRRRRYLAGLRQRLRVRPPALIEIHNRAEFVDRIARWFPRARLALHLHNDPQAMRAAGTVVERRALLDRLNAVYCVSAYIRDRLLDGIDDEAAHEKVHVIHNGIDTVATAGLVEKLNMAGGTDAAGRDPVILFVGRIVADKGALLFVEAAGQALEGLPGWRAVMVGADRPSAGAVDTAKLTEYERKVHAAVDGLNRSLGPRGGESAITMTGFMPFDRVLETFGRAAIAVVPSQWPEPFGRTALEAMAMGCPVIATPRGGLPDVLGDTGAMLRLDDPAVLASQIRELAGDAGQRAAMGAAERVRAREAFDIRVVTSALDRVRASLLKSLQLQGPGAVK